MKTKTSSILLVILFTFIVTIAQLLMKKGAMTESYLNIVLFLGLVLYGIATMIFIVALKGGELSSLYPLISLGFVWVAIASYFMLGETFTIKKTAGIIMIIGGVSLLGIRR